MVASEDELEDFCLGRSVTLGVGPAVAVLSRVFVFIEEMKDDSVMN